MKRYIRLTDPVMPEVPLIPGSAAAKKAERLHQKTALDIRSEYWDWVSKRSFPTEDRPSYSAFLQKVSSEFLTNGNGPNRVISPFSLYQALLMLADLCEGDTRQEILQALDSDDIEKLRADFAS